MYIDHSDKLLESWCGINNVLAALVENEIPFVEKNKRMLDTAAIFIDEIKKITEKFSVLYKQITTVLNQ